MGNARTRTTFRSLCFVAFASASSSVFWSSAPRPVVREQAPRQKSRSSFQEIERRIDDKVTPPVTDGATIANGSASANANGSASGESPLVKENQKKLKLFVDKPLGEAENEEKPDEEPSFEFAKAEKVLKGIQGRLLIIKDASEENHATIEEHRGKIQTQRTAFETFVKKLNDELKILRNGMKCINLGAQIIAKIASRPSFLETESGAFIDRGTVPDGGCGGGEVGEAGSTSTPTSTAAAAVDDRKKSCADEPFNCQEKTRAESGTNELCVNRNRCSIDEEKKCEKPECKCNKEQCEKTISFLGSLCGVGDCKEKPYTRTAAQQESFWVCGDRDEDSRKIDLLSCDCKAEADQSCCLNPLLDEDACKEYCGGGGTNYKKDPQSPFYGKYVECIKPLNP